MTLWKRCTALALGGFLFATACSGPVSAIRTQAASDLTCDSAAIDVRGPDAGVYYARGCGKQWRYVVACNAGGYCVSPEGVDVQSILTKQSGFDLGCSGDQLAITELNGDTFGVTGCGKKASYVLVCQSSRDCKAVQNTQSQ